jgi:hypothetical protein
MVLASTVGAGHVLEVRIVGCLVAEVGSGYLAGRMDRHLDAVHIVGHTVQEPAVGNRDLAGKDCGVAEAEHWGDADDSSRLLGGGWCLWSLIRGFYRTFSLNIVRFFES